VEETYEGNVLRKGVVEEMCGGSALRLGAENTGKGQWKRYVGAYINTIFKLYMYIPHTWYTL
jgi:hypothetical protein